MGCVWGEIALREAEMQELSFLPGARSAPSELADFVANIIRELRSLASALRITLRPGKYLSS